MLFKSKEDLPSAPPEMFHGPRGDRHPDPNANPQERHHRMGPNPQMWSYMMPMMREMWHEEKHKQHRGCHRRQWKCGMERRVMNPEEYQEMVHKMHQAREENFKAHHRHGFCWRRFSSGRNNEDKQNPTSEYFFNKQTLHSNLYC